MTKIGLKMTILLILFSLTIQPLSAKTLSERLSGRILLQTEGKGEAWYVSPLNQKRYYLGKPEDAFDVIKNLGLGVSNANFQKFEKNLPQKFFGRILIKTEDKGKAYYGNPLDKKLYFLGRPGDAFKLMRRFGLGISDSDLKNIKEDPTSSTRRQKKELKTITIKINTPELSNTGTTTSETNINPNPTTSSSTDSELSASSTASTASTTLGTASSTSLSDKCEFLNEYFRNETLRGAPVSQEKKFGLSYDWGTSSPELLGNYTDKFSVRFTGNCYFEAGTYEFTTKYDDAVKATIDSFWLANSWRNNNEVKTTVTTLDITEGMHIILVKYYDHLNNAVISLDWKKL